MELKTVHKVNTILASVMAAFFVLMWLFKSTVFGTICIVIVAMDLIGIFVFSYIFLRCPACSRSLVGKLDPHARYCPHCGTNIED